MLRNHATGNQSVSYNIIIISQMDLFVGNKCMSHKQCYTNSRNARHYYKWLIRFKREKRTKIIYNYITEQKEKERYFLL